METRKATLSCNLFILSIAAISASGCELVASVDRSLIDQQPGSSAGGGGGMGTGGMSTSASSSSMSAGGAGGGCTTAMECPDPMNECVTATCMAGACGTENVTAGMAVMMQTAGDCKVNQCDGSGAVETVDDDNDLPDDNMQCTQNTCSAGMPMHPPAQSATPCNESGGSYCNGAGMCVQCTLNAHCMSGICTNNQCVMINGCSATSAMDMTGQGSVTVNFGGMPLGNNYDPKCLKVSQGTVVTFSANGMASFVFHPLMGGEVINAMKVPAMMGTSPFVPMTNMGTTAAFTMSNTGNFPYYCDAHALGGMTGVVFVVP